MSVARTPSLSDRTARHADLAARERSARHQAEQWAHRPSTARDIRQHADRLREMRQGGRR